MSYLGAQCTLLRFRASLRAEGNLWGCAAIRSFPGPARQALCDKDM